MNEHPLREGFGLLDRTVYPLEGRIEGPEGSRHVQPKVMEVLVFLAHRSGQVITRDEIVDTVWKGSVVTDEALTRCISELRHTFQDSKKRPRFIQTIPKRGYRLLATAEPLHRGSKSSDSVTTTANTSTFWQELNRRNVVRVGLAYTAIAFAILGGADLLVDILQLPDSTLRFLLLVLVIGFPIALALAWTFQVTPDGLALDLPTLQESTAPNRSHQNRLNALIVVASIAAIGLWFSQTNEPGVNSADANDGYRNSVAVLRFRSFGDDPRLVHFGDGLGEELALLLYRTKLVKVPSREWAWSLAGQETPVIAQRLDVRNVVEGSIQTEEDRIRVTVRLLGRNGKTKWNRSYDRQFVSLLDLQNEIAKSILVELKIKLSAEAQQDLEQTLTNNPDAYLTYIEGRYFLREPPTPATLKRARQSFEEAIALDTEFAAAFAGLCDTHLAMYQMEETTQSVSSAKNTCQKAIDLSPELNTVYVSLARLNRFLGFYPEAETAIKHAIKLRADSVDAVLENAAILAAQRKTLDAEKMYKNAIRIEPLFWKVHRSLGYFLITNGKVRESRSALEQVTRLVPDDAVGYSDLGGIHYLLGNFSLAANAYQKSLELAPTEAAYSNIASAQFYLGHFEQAIELYEEAMKLNPGDHRILGNLADAQQYGQQEQNSLATYRRAIEVAERGLEINPNDGETLSDLAYYYASVDELGRAHETLGRALQLTPEDMYTHYRAALVNVRENKPEEALTALENAISLGYQPTLLLQDPGLATISENERFLALLEE